MHFIMHFIVTFLDGFFYIKPRVFRVYSVILSFYFPVPTLPPTICSGFNVSKNEIQVLWGEVPRADRNGIILGYNIYTTEVFNYFATMPPDYEVSHTRVVVNTTDESARAFLQHNLVPYTDYSFQVDAFTSKGNGPNCTAFIVRTEEEGRHH